MPYYYCVECDTTNWVKTGEVVVCGNCGKLLQKEEADESETDNY